MFSQMTLKQRLRWFIAFVCGIQAAVALLVFVQLASTEEHLAGVAHRDMPVLAALYSASEHTFKQQVVYNEAFRNYIENHPDKYQERKEKFDKLEKVVKDDFTKVSELIAGGAEHATGFEAEAFKKAAGELAILKEQHKNWQKHVYEVFGYLENGDLKNADTLGEVTDKEAAKIAKVGEDLYFTIEKMTEAAVISIEHQATRLEYIVIVATVISISFALFLSSRIISFLVKSLDKVFQSLAIMANGDFSVPCKVNLPGMLGNLQENTEKTRQSINKMLAGIADEVVESSGSLSEVSKEVQSIVDSQSREIMQVVTSTDELASSATQIAENANSTHDTTENVLSQANESLKLNDDVVKQIELLVDSLTQSSHALGKLEENSHNITTVLDVIKGIAEQTNLLALNAAIEAARAGDQGRGFAVVADEVRNLAKRTHDSTSEIETMISQFDGVTKDAVDTMQQSCELGDKTINIAKQSSDLLNTSNSSISKVNEMNLEVASAATQQSSVVEEMNVNVNRINEKAEASSEQVKALLHAVDQLCHVSDNLMKATGRAGT